MNTNILRPRVAHCVSPLIGSTRPRPSGISRTELRTLNGWFWVPITLLMLSPPLKVLAEGYTDPQVKAIAVLVNDEVSGALSLTAFEIAVSPYIEAQGVTSDLIEKLCLFNPRPSSKGIDILIATSNKAVAAKAKRNKATANAKAKQEQAAAKAKAIAEAHDSAVTAHNDAKTAAAAAETAHRAAANDPSKAAEAAAMDQASAAAVQKSTTADLAPALKVDPIPPTNSMWSVLIWSGAKLQNPYSITNGALKPNNTKTDGFIDLELIHRYVLSSDASGTDDLFFSWFDTHDGKRKFAYGKWDWFFPGQVFPDLDFRVGYVFGGSSTPTNLTVSTIAGGSDFYSDNSIGIPFWRWSQPGSFDQQATIELGGGFVTDKQFLVIHPNYFLGLGYQYHNKDWTWQTRFGLGAADVPHLSSGSTVATNSTGLPLFDLKRAPSWGTVITYNLSSAVKLQLGANAYFDTRAIWNLSAGLSVDPVALFSTFATKK